MKHGAATGRVAWCPAQWALSMTTDGMEYEYTSPRKRPHVDETTMDVDPPIRRPLVPAASPFAAVPLRTPMKPTISTLPSNSFTFTPQPSFAASAPQRSRPEPHPSFAASAPQRSRPEPGILNAIVLAGSDPETLDLSRHFEIASVSDTAGIRAKQRRQSPPRRSMSKERRRRNRRADAPTVMEDEDRTINPVATTMAAPAQHLSLHQHTYGHAGAHESIKSHWWREDAPYVLLGYLQVIFNAALVALGLYLLFSFVVTIQNDVLEKMESYSNEIRQESIQCLTAYTSNNCDPATRAPALTAACLGWEQCMNRDARIVGRARVGAETFAEVLDSFVMAISWKTMLFLFLSFTLVVTLTNSAILSVRHRVQPQAATSGRPERPPMPHWPASAPAELQTPDQSSIIPSPTPSQENNSYKRPWWRVL